MTTTPPAAQADHPVTDRWRRWRRAGHVAAVVVVSAGVGVAVVRPTAPPVGEALSAGTWFDPEALQLADAYRGPREVAAGVVVALRIGFALALAASPLGRRIVRGIADRLGHRPWLAAGVLAAGAVATLDVLLSPIAFWSGYLHDGAFGLRTQGLGGWVVDWFAFRVPSWVGAAVLAAGGYALAGRFRRGWPPLVAGVGAVLVVVVVMASPVILEPLAHRTTPLEDPRTRTAIEEIGAAAGVEVDEIVVADASRRSVHENAYISGLGSTRRIVLYDTLLAARDPDEIRVLVAHELAHHEHRDIERGVLTGAAAVVAAVYALWWWLRWRTRRGLQRDVTDPRAIGAVVAAVMLVSVLATPAESALSRRMEAAADWRALELTGDPAAYERLKVELAVTNLSRPEPSWWPHRWSGTHPTTAERLTMAAHWRATADQRPATSGPDDRTR